MAHQTPQHPRRCHYRLVVLQLSGLQLYSELHVSFVSLCKRGAVKTCTEHGLQDPYG